MNVPVGLLAVTTGAAGGPGTDVPSSGVPPTGVPSPGAPSSGVPAEGGVPVPGEPPVAGGGTVPGSAGTGAGRLGSVVIGPSGTKKSIVSGSGGRGGPG